MKIKAALTTAGSKLRLISDNYALEARILLAYSLAQPIEYLLLNLELDLTTNQISSFNTLIKRRLSLEPIAYIIGYKEFYGLNFEVTKDVLIPRNDSEVLIDAIIADYRDNFYHHDKIHNTLRELNQEPFRMLELGIGSGCLSVILLVTIPNLYITATDISPAALEVAAKNAKKHKVLDRINLVQSSWYDKIELEATRKSDVKYDVIFSNPPYITPDEQQDIAPETLGYEPHIALFDNSEDSSYYHIAIGAAHYLKPKGSIFVETGYKNHQKVEGIFSGLGYKVLQRYKDLSGYIRVISFGR